MPLDKALIAMGTLFVLGAAGGFALSSQVSPAAVDSMLQHRAGAGNEGQGGAAPGKPGKRGGAPQMANDARSGGSEHGGAGGGRQGREGSGSGTEEADTGGKSAANVEHKAVSQDNRADESRPAAGGGARAGAAPVAASDEPGGDGASSPCRSTELTGAEAAAFLSGNTASGASGDDAVPEITYFAPRGWIARFRPDAMVVKAWNVEAATLCGPDPRSGSSTVCDVIRARKCLDPDHARVHIGDVRGQDGRWMRVLKGNLQDFPAYIPYLDPRPAALPDARTGKGSKERRPRREQDRFASEATYRYLAPDAVDRDRVVHFEGTGRLLDFLVPTADEVQNGVSIKASRWETRHEDLCGGGFSADAKPTCWTMGGRNGHLLLTSRSGAAKLDLVAVRDAGPVAAADGDRLALLPRPDGAGAASGADRRPAKAPK